MRFSTASVRTNTSRRTQCSNGLQPSADSKRDCPNSRGNLFLRFFLGGGGRGKWVMIRETNSLLKKTSPRKHQLAKRGHPPPKTSAQTCLGSSLRRPHTHYYYDNPSVAEEEIQNPYLRLTIPNHSIHPQLTFPIHTVLKFGISGENSFILEITPLVTLPLRSCAPHRQRASVRFRLRISGHKTTPQNKCYRRAPLGE